MAAIYTGLRHAELEALEWGHRADFHDLRKTYGTLMQLTGVNPRTAQELMRHSDIKLTTQIYTDANLLPKTAAIYSLPDITSVIPTVISDMTKQGITSLGESQLPAGSTPLSTNDMAGLGAMSPEMPQRENGARGGIRTLDCAQCLLGRLFRISA